MAATIKEVAERAQVSTATVSYVLNGTGTVTEATRLRVLAAVAELQYQPNHAARSLRSRSRTLGLVLSALAVRLSDPTLVEVLAGFSEAAARQGYYLLLATAGDKEAEAQLSEQLVRTGRVDGVVLLDLENDDERVAYLQERGILFVCAGPIPATASCSSVAINGRVGAERAVQHLLGLGHRRIGLIALPSYLAGSEPMYEGYVAALAEAGVADDPALVVEAGTAENDGLAAMQELLSLPEPPTGVLAASDALAFGALHALRDANVQVGRGCSLIGFDDVPMAEHSDPPLTTMRAPRQLLGSELARLLIEMIETKGRRRSQVVLEMQLVVRRSTGKVL
jgi:DNA-binding LacI/PurR family transcriptional regulator